MRIRAKYKGKVVYIIGFTTGSGCYGLPQELAIIAIKTYRGTDIEAVKLYELTIIDEDYIPKCVEVK